jgi:membrane-bound metal-dependent hydrolase YbcI (DUF457 family)
MAPPMPSPIGHLLAGTTVAWLAAPARRVAPGVPPADLNMPALTVVCALLATLPDLDLLYQPLHRTATHSLLSAAVVTIVATVVTGWVTPGSGALRMGILCGLAWSSHLLLDWMGTDTNPPRGIQLFWPFSDRWFIAGWDLFPPTERRDPLSAATLARNARTAAYEIAVLGTVAAAAWFMRTRRQRH